MTPDLSLKFPNLYALISNKRIASCFFFASIVVFSCRKYHKISGNDKINAEIIKKSKVCSDEIFVYLVALRLQKMKQYMPIFWSLNFAMFSWLEEIEGSSLQVGRIFVLSLSEIWWNWECWLDQSCLISAYLLKKPKNIKYTFKLKSFSFSIVLLKFLGKLYFW